MNKKTTGEISIMNFPMALFIIAATLFSSGCVTHTNSDFNAKDQVFLYKADELVTNEGYEYCTPLLYKTKMSRKDIHHTTPDSQDDIYEYHFSCQDDGDVVVTCEYFDHNMVMNHPHLYCRIEE